MQIEVKSAEAMQALGQKIGHACRGGEVIELVGDIGAGKTTLVKGLAAALGVADDVQSPTFTISRVYEAPSGIMLAHYDFYRLHEAGVMQVELAEAMADPQTTTVIEWAAVVQDVLPSDCLSVTIAVQADDSRTLSLAAGGEKSRYVLESLA